MRIPFPFGGSYVAIETNAHLGIVMTDTVAREKRRDAITYRYERSPLELRAGSLSAFILASC